MILLEENNGGGRLTADRKGRRKRAVLAAACAIAAALVCAYLALCAYAGRDVVWPNTTVLDLDVSGQDPERAADRVALALERSQAGRTISFYVVENNAKRTVETLSAKELMEPDGLAGQLRQSQSGSFLTAGARFLSHLLSGEGGNTPALRFTAAGEARMEEAIASLSRQLEAEGRDTAWTLTETELVLTKGRTDVKLDAEAIRRGVEDALNGVGLSDEVAVSLTEEPPAAPDFAAIREDLYTPAQAAYLDRETEEIVPSVTGKDFDPALARSALEALEEGRTYRMELELTVPSPTTEELSETLFRDVLGEAETHVTGTADRKMNVKAAAAFLNGKIVFPGDEFSFNQTCSPYSVDNGYGKATAYVNGLSKDTVAGGICQASSTLYWATLKANLETVERSAHRYEPSYIRGGLDATVYGDYGDDGGLDFRFRNTSGSPIKLEACVDEKNYLHVLIHGTDVTGVHGEPYSANRVVTQAYQTIYQASDTVPQGTTQKDPERTGYNGVSIETYQKLVDADGQVVEEKLLYKTKYYVRNEVIYFHPGDLALWGIDPYTGLRTEPPAEETPAEEPSPEISGETVPPAEEESPAPAEGELPAESQLPVESYAPDLPILPAQTDPADDPLLPPGL